MENKCYLGIDLTEQTAMISYYRLNMREPETVSPVVGSEVYQIPLLLAKQKQQPIWYYGDEAKQKGKKGEAICIESLLEKAMKEQMVEIEGEKYEAIELFSIFLKKIMKLPELLGNSLPCDCLFLTVERLTKENMAVFRKVAVLLGLSQEQFMVINHKESFYYYTLNQQESLWMHDVYLFEADKQSVHFYELERNIRTIPQVITIKESQRIALKEQKDMEFLSILKKNFENHRVSCTYLVGEGFDDDWMKESLAFLCRGRRVFLGNNLFSKGACYAAYIRDYQKPWNFIYIGENDMKFNLSLKIKNRGNEETLTLIAAGRSYFEMESVCEVILDGSAEIVFLKRLPQSKEAVLEKLQLTDLPKRPNKTTRIRITAIPSSDNEIAIEIRDLGFGDICKSSKKVWNYTITM